jgi:3-hydroxyisobutyrate dehydrogenase-like beta-hydroxyacid dehydrogenase
MRIVRESSLYAPQFDKKLPGMLRRDFVKANFPTKHFFKDIGLMLQEGHTLGLETSALRGCWRAAKKALDKGWVDTDYSSVYNVIDPEK